MNRGHGVVLALPMKIPVHCCRDTRLSGVEQSERPEWIDMQTVARRSLTGQLRKFAGRNSRVGNGRSQGDAAVWLRPLSSVGKQDPAGAGSVGQTHCLSNGLGCRAG